MYRQLLIATLLLGTGITRASSQQVNADVQHYDISLTLNDKNDKIDAVTGITVRFLQDVSAFRIDLVGRTQKETGMTVSSVTEGKMRIPFQADSTGIRLAIRGKRGETHTYRITYSGIPADGLIISKNIFGRRTFFTDNWPDRAHHWLPCVDHPSDKAAVDLSVTAPDHYTVVANGVKTEETQLAGQLKRTRYSEKAPLPTKIIAIGVADFAVDHTADVQGIPVYSYVYPENKEKGFRAYAPAAKILEYFIGKIGPYAYGKLANIQSTTIYGGMENAGAIFYAEESVSSPYVEELLAHEVAHQWFGDAITETGWQHVWLSEGFATYMTLLYMESKYGTDTLKAELADDRLKVIALNARRHTPIVDTAVHSNYKQLLNANSYQKGSWVLHMLRRQVGDSIFMRGIRDYFAAFKGRNANTEDFRHAMEKAGAPDLTAFFQQWLYTAGMPVLKVDLSPVNDDKTVTVTIRQMQKPLFSFPLEYVLTSDATLKRINIDSEITTIKVPLTGADDNIHLDPHVNLLFNMYKSEQ